MLNRQGKPVGKMLLIGTAWVSPFLVICWGGIRLLFSRGSWFHKLFALSLLGNVFSAVVFAIGYYEYSKDPGGELPSEGMLIAPECVYHQEGPVQVCVAPADSQLADLFPNTVYVAFDGISRGRFEFVDDNMQRLREVTICDSRGRPWIDAELDTGTMIYTRYLTPTDDAALVTFVDEDADGIPDIKMDWVREIRFERDGELTWRRIDKE